MYGTTTTLFAARKFNVAQVFPDDAARFTAGSSRSSAVTLSWDRPSETGETSAAKGHVIVRSSPEHFETVAQPKPEHATAVSKYCQTKSIYAAGIRMTVASARLLRLPPVNSGPLCTSLVRQMLVQAARGNYTGLGYLAQCSGRSIIYFTFPHSGTCIQ